MNEHKIEGIIAIIVIVVIAVGALAYIGTSDIRQREILIGEANKLGEMDITKENVDMTIKTTGDYAIVEQTMKEYINTYSNNLKEVEKILEDERLAQVLTSDNYENDGPNFIETKSYINETRENFNTKINTLIEMTSEENMMKAIEDKNLSQEMNDLYKQLMLGEEMTTDFQETAKSLQESSDTINAVLDVQENVINMLIANKDKWEINDEGEIVFATQKLVDEYNGYLQNL